MINLLPTHVKETNKYGLKNRLLLRWVIAFIIAIAGIWTIVLFGFYQLNNSINDQKELIAHTKQRLKDQDIEGVQEQTEDIESSIRLALQVLDQKILFSKLIQQIGAVMPEGAILQDISLQDVQGGIDLTAKVKDHQSATQVLINISDPANHVFAKADMLSIDCGDEGTEESAEAQAGSENSYPCTAKLVALFGDNSPFLYTYEAEEQTNE